MDDYVAYVDASGAGWTTWARNEQGELVPIASYAKLSDAPQTRAVVTTVRILVKIGKTVVGGVAAKVVDGVIIEVTGNSMLGWVKIAASRLIGHVPPPGYVLALPCSVYPPNSGEYVRCMS